jgi:hypothetical protein
MENFIQLNLHIDNEKPEAEHPPRPEDRDSVEREKRLNRIANMTAHKAAKQFARERMGIFSK